MYGFSMAALLLLSRGRIVGATLGTALALLSKESAMVLPAIALAYALAIERRRPLDALRRTAPMWVALAGWAFVHPLLAGRIFHPPLPASPPAAAHWINPLAGSLLLQATLSLVNLDAPLAPMIPWKAVAWGALGPIAALAIPALVVAWRAGRRGKAPGAGAAGADGPPGPGRVAAFGAVWAVVGWLPLLQPPLTWHAYYGLFGALGAWLALGVLIARARWLLAPVLAALVLLHLAQAATPSLDLGTEFYQIRASNFVRLTRSFLLTQASELPPHSRIFLAQVPGSVGLIPWDRRSIAPQIWTGDTTLTMYYVSRFHPREAGDTLGRDILFSYDNRKGWSSQDIVVPTTTSSPDEVKRYAKFLWSIGRAADAHVHFERLVERNPGDWSAAFNLGTCYFKMGDSLQGRRWYERAASIPGAPPELVEAARHGP
jgi:hypothetical protein